MWCSAAGFQPLDLCYSCSLLLMICKTPVRIFADDNNIFLPACNNTKEVELTFNEELKLVLKYCAINKFTYQ